jgi:hypothetical protein
MRAARLMKIFEECCEYEGKKTCIVCEEKRTKITFHNATKETVAKIRIDGCVIPDNTVKKCDYLLLCTAIEKAIFVELKGNKVETAIEQLSATLDNETIKIPLEHYEKRAYAVATVFPKSNTGIQNAQDRFARKGCRLKVVKSSRTYDLSSGNSIT